MLRIALLGDIVGQAGVRAVVQQLPPLRERFRPDLIVANGENASQGSGITPDIYARLKQAGVDGITLGDHVYRKRQIIGTLQRENDIIRPANLSGQAEGKPWMRLRPRTLNGGEPIGDLASAPNVYVLTVLGRLWMSLPANDPFYVVEQTIASLPETHPIVLVEIHAEATSEKQAMGWRFNGVATCVYGTHTHVATNDARVLPTHLPGDRATDRTDQSAARGGTAYLTDLGMCGPIDSVLGRKVEPVLHHMTTSMPAPFDVAEGNPRVMGALVEVDEQTRRAVSIEPIQMAADVTKPPFV